MRRRYCRRLPPASAPVDVAGRCGRQGRTRTGSRASTPLYPLRCTLAPGAKYGVRRFGPQAARTVRQSGARRLAPRRRSISQQEFWQCILWQILRCALARQYGRSDRAAQRRPSPVAGGGWLARSAALMEPAGRRGRRRSGRRRRPRPCCAAAEARPGGGQALAPRAARISAAAAAASRRASLATVTKA